MQATEARETKAMSWLEWILLLVVRSCAAVSCEGVQAAAGLCPKESFVPPGSIISAAEKGPQHPAEHHHSLTHFSQCPLLQKQLWVPSPHPAPLILSGSAGWDLILCEMREKRRTASLEPRTISLVALGWRPCLQKALQSNIRPRPASSAQAETAHTGGSMQGDAGGMTERNKD